MYLVGMTTQILPLKQAPRQCGQTCLAMLSGKTVQEVLKTEIEDAGSGKYVKIVGKSTTNVFGLQFALQVLGVYVDERGPKLNPTREHVGTKVGLMRVGWLKQNSPTKVKRCGHFVVVAEGKVYEPIDGKIYDYEEYMSTRRCRPTHFIEVLLP